MDRCPYIRGLRAGDESIDFCQLTARPSGSTSLCVLVTGSVCDEWEEIKSEDGYEEYERAGVMPGNLCNNGAAEYSLRHVQTNLDTEESK